MNIKEQLIAALLTKGQQALAERYLDRRCS